MKNSTHKAFTVAIILLVLANIAMVVMLIKGRKDHQARRPSNRTNPSEMMVKELGMNDQQQKDYQQLKDEHMKNIRPLFDSIRTAKSVYFELIKDPGVTDSTISIYGKHITDLQSRTDRIIFEHFRKVRNLFTGDQQKKFDDFVQRMMQRNPGGPGRKKDSTGKGS